MTREEFIAAIKNIAVNYSDDSSVAEFEGKVIALATTSWPEILPPAAPGSTEVAEVTVTAPAAPGPPTVCLDDAGFIAFFNGARDGPPLGPALSQKEVDGCNILLKECCRVHWPLSWTAYALATAYHETAGTMQPIREYGKGRGRPYGIPGPDNGQIAYGRGYVQLTWFYNYHKADKALGLNGALINNYDLALDPQIAARIMTWGMESGAFTGKSIDLYLPAMADIHQFANARRVINALDKAVQIAEYALEFQAYLSGNWRC